MHLPFSPRHLWPLVVMVDRTLRLSVRWTVIDPAGELRDGASGAAHVFACRHGQLWPLLWAVEDCRVGVLVSRSGDGELLARVLESRKVRLLRGSSSREGSVAARLTIRELLAGRNVGLALDGPRGPRGSISEGVLRIAQRTGARIVPMHVEGSGRLVLRGTWDAFELPVPAGRLRVHVAPGLHVAPGPEGVRTARRELERALDSAEAGTSTSTARPGEEASLARPR